MTKLSHLDDNGKASMVDVSAKNITHRKAIAKGTVSMKPETLAMVTEGKNPKGDVLATARLAGIMAAKRTADLIPLCHSLPLDHVSVDFAFDQATGQIGIEATATTSGRTGVEIEALTAVSVAGLTLYDMCKAVDRGMTIGDIRLVYKSGGKSDVFVAE